MEKYNVALTTLVQEFGLQVIYAATDYQKIRLTVDDVARPGLQLAGYYEHFDPKRLQVLGNLEMSYVAKLTNEQRAVTFEIDDGVCIRIGGSVNILNGKRCATAHHDIQVDVLL